MNEPPVVQVKRLQQNDDAQQAYCCMTEVPSPWPKALCQCRDWVQENLGVHVDGYHLQLESGEVIGHIYFAPSENALFSYQIESSAAVLYCEWVQQRYQKMGFGTRLFEAFLKDQRKNGAKGLVVETTDIEGQMHFSHYQTRGFRTIHKAGHNRLMFFPLSAEQVQFEPRQIQIHARAGIPVEIHLFRGFLCPYEVSTQITIRQVAQEFGNQVVLHDVWLTAETLEKYGIASGVLINGKRKLAGGETERAVRQAIQEEL